MDGWALIYYETQSGHCPLRDYIDRLDGLEAARVTNELEILGRFGILLGAPHARHLGGKLWELRVRGRLQHRVLYFTPAGRQIVLLHAFTKRTEKTPRKEIEVARRRMIDFVEREKR